MRRVRHLSTALAILVGTLVAGATTCPADQIALSASKDTTIYSDGTTLSNGSGNGVFSGRTAANTNGALRRALIAFDVGSAIPAGATITSVQLTLHLAMSVAGPQTTALHRLLADWGEAGSNAEGPEGEGAPAAAGDATWRFRFFNTQRWTADGGDFTGTASASAVVPDTGAITWGSTAGLVADVQGWVDAPGTNFGWLIRGNETVLKTAKKFFSRQASIATNRPQLVVVFDPPVGITTTPTPTVTASPSVLPSQTNTPSATHVATATPTATTTMTVTPTRATTATNTITATPTFTITATPTRSSTSTPTATVTHTAVVTPTETAPPTSTASETGTTASTSSPTETATAPAMATATVTATDTATATVVVTGTAHPPTPTVTTTASARVEPSATATTVAQTATPTASPPSAACTGDCDGSGAVTIDELITGVNIALGRTALNACPRFDGSGDGNVTVNELIAAVRNALDGCARNLR